MVRKGLQRIHREAFVKELSEQKLSSLRIYLEKFTKGLKDPKKGYNDLRRDILSVEELAKEIKVLFEKNEALF